MKDAALIKEFYEVSDNIICFEVDKAIDKFFVPNFKGVQILAMSKRIMNEEICLAEDLDIMIYYKDTDSIHIPVEKFLCCKMFIKFSMEKNCVV